MLCANLLYGGHYNMSEFQSVELGDWPKNEKEKV